ncbi:MAG: hypothetical protein GY870_21155 [archaeon]|nr:hypothetical protein [archaeon]
MLKISQKRNNNYLYPLMVISTFSCLLIARIMWPSDVEPFSDAWETISGLGNIEINIPGFIFFQISMVSLGVGIFTTFLYVHSRLKEKSKILNFFGAFCMLIGSLGIILTGLIPAGIIESIEKSHEITAGLGFLGVLFASFFYFWAIKRNLEVYNHKLLNNITVIWWIGIILTIISYTMAELIIKPQILIDQGIDLGWYGPEWGDAGVSIFYSFALWERVMFMIVIIYLGSLGYIIPDEE